MEDLLGGDFRPVRKAPPPPRPHSNPSVNHSSGDFIIIDVKDNPKPKPGQSRSHNGMPRCSSAPSMKKKKPPPPRPPPPKTNPSQKPHAHGLNGSSRNSSVKSGSVMGGVLGKLRGPPPRPKASHAHQSTSAPTTPSGESCLIKFDSPPDSPNMRSGSDGLSLNSFGSEGSSGNHSSGFEDSFDPFGSINEPVYGFGGGKRGTNSSYGGPPLGFQQPDIFSSINNKNTVNSNNSINLIDPFGDIPQQENFLDTADPFELIAKRIEAPVIASSKPVNNSSSNIGSVINWDTPQTSVIQPAVPVQQPIQPQPTAVPTLQQAPAPQPQSGAAETTKPKTSFKATIIRPKQAITGNHVEGAGGRDISRELGGLDFNTGSNKTLGLTPSVGWDCSSLVDQTIPEEAPPLPPRPPEEEGAEDSPYGIAEFDFEATQQDDLAFKVGSTIQLLYRVSDDWLFGRCGHSEGMFPQSFIKIVVPLAGESVPDQLSNSSTPTNSPDSDIIPQQVPSKDESASSNVATVLYTFMAEQHGDLTIYEGDDVKVLGRFSDEWLFGESSGRTGQFPSNFIEKVPENLPQM